VTSAEKQAWRDERALELVRLGLYNAAWGVRIGAIILKGDPDFETDPDDDGVTG
jgi:hypothetical protein